jgi:hypothetical protein
VSATLKPSVGTLIAQHIQQLQGSRVRGTIPVAEALLNRLLSSLPNKSSQLEAIHVRIGAGGRLQLNIRARLAIFSKWFRPELALSRSLDFENNPVLAIAVVSPGYGLLLNFARTFTQQHLPSAVRIEGNMILINLAEYPLVQENRNILRYLQVSFRSEIGSIFLDVDFNIPEGKTLQ